MRIGILTSSRADFGIYLPMLKALKEDAFFEVSIIAFGTHLSGFYGATVRQIEEEGFEVKHRIASMLQTDSPESIATAMGLTTVKFAAFWEAHQQDYDVVFCLGDRYEMFAAVTAGIPFQVPFAHFHGGETTLGAIDNVFRHAITLASTYHFVATDIFASRVKEIIQSDDQVFVVGALSLDNLSSLPLLSVEEFKTKWHIDLGIPTILTTFHPETVHPGKNTEYISSLINVIETLDHYQVLITMPNADTAGNEIRSALLKHFSHHKRIFLVESLGTKGYFTAMKYAAFLLGNTSSGIIEAASFGKPVINLGDRQKGRLSGANVIHCQVNEQEILNAVAKIERNEIDCTENIYWNGGATHQVINILKSL